MDILIVDDSTMVRKMVHKLASRFNFDNIYQAENGRVALEIFREKSPSIVTLDITMPEVDGLTALDEMLKINADAKVIILTALNDKATAIDAIDRGAVDFLSKPFDAEKLESTLNRVMPGGA